MREYNAKEISVFEGVLSLAKSGENIYTLKVQQIADACAIGKGTLYEYFSSREEIIAQALVFSMYKELDEFENAINKENSYNQKLCAALDFAHDTVTASVSSFSLLNAAMHEPAMRSLLCTSTQEQNLLLERMYCILNSVINVGRKEHLISSDSDDGYCLMAAISVLCTVAYTCAHANQFNNWQNIRKNALKMLSKSLI